MSDIALPHVTLADIELHADNLDPARAAAIYKEHGCLVVRGLARQYVDDIARDIETIAGQSVSLLDQARKTSAGWETPDGTLFIPAPAGFKRDKQIMVLGMRYTTSAAFFHSAFDARLLDVVEGIVGPDVELFMDGQSLYKEPVGGHPKNLHQDGSYFEHKYDGPVAILNYVVPTNEVNGALYVVPGSHKLGMLRHIDTSSHLGLDPDEWPWEKALRIDGEPGDAIFFHVLTIHGSKENHSEKARPVFIHRYRRPDDYVVVDAHNVEDREKLEKMKAEARKDQQQGFMVRGVRRYSAP